MPSNAIRPLFSLGKTCATPGAMAVITEGGVNVAELLEAHQCGDWGDTLPDDQARNAEAIRDHERIISWHGTGDLRLMIVTEADRSSTTVLTPGEY
jgi:hypothetical protein